MNSQAKEASTAVPTRSAIFPVGTYPNKIDGRILTDIELSIDVRL